MTKTPQHLDAYGIMTDPNLFTTEGVPIFGAMFSAIEHYALTYRPAKSTTLTLGDRVNTTILSEEVQLPLFGAEYLSYVRQTDVGDLLLSMWGPEVGDYVLVESRLYTLTDTVDKATILNNGFLWVPTLEQLVMAGGLEDRADTASVIVRYDGKYIVNSTEVTDLHLAIIKPVIEKLSIPPLTDPDEDGKM